MKSKEMVVVKECTAVTCGNTKTTLPAGRVQVTEREVSDQVFNPKEQTDEALKPGEIKRLRKDGCIMTTEEYKTAIRRQNTNNNTEEEK